MFYSWNEIDSVYLNLLNLNQCNVMFWRYVTSIHNLFKADSSYLLKKNTYFQVVQLLALTSCYTIGKSEQN